MSSDDQSPSTAHTDVETTTSDVLSMAKIYDRYPGQWILLRVTEDDEDYWPAAGRIMIRASTQQALLAELERQTVDAPLPRRGAGPPCMFCAYPDIKPGSEFEALLAELRPDLTAST